MAEDHAETPKYDPNDMYKMIKEKTPVTLTLPLSPELADALQGFCDSVEFIVQTVNEYERVAVLDLVTYPELELGGQHPPAEKPALCFPHLWLRIWLGMFAGLKCAVVQTKMGSYCASEIEEALKQCPKARVILAIGVAYALNPDKTKLGDVLCSNSIFAYSGNTKIDRGNTFPRNDSLHHYSKMPPQLLKIFKQESNWVAIKSFTCSDKTGRVSKAHVGSMISWEMLINDQKLRDDIRDSIVHKETIGGEMEGVQLVRIHEQASAKPGDRQIDVVIIKGVSDFADGSKNKNWQLTAAMAAASYTKYCLENRPEPKLLTEFKGHEDYDGGTPHTDETIQVDYLPRDDELSDLHRVMLKYKPKLVLIISNPGKLANELVAEFLLSPATQDDVSSTRGISRHDKADEIIGEVVRHFEGKKDDHRNFLKFCKVLKAHGQPGLRELAEEMERLSKKI